MTNLKFPHRRKFLHLVAGAAADCFSLRSELPVMTGRQGDVSLDSFIFGGSTSRIDEVWRAGRKVVEQGVHCARSEVNARYRAALERLVS